MESIFELQADVCKTFANPKRLEILNALREEELTAGRLLEMIEISKANLSQHMGMLIRKGVVESRREGVNVYYRLSDNRIIRACDLMKEILVGRLEKNESILKDIRQ